MLTAYLLTTYYSLMILPITKLPAPVLRAPVADINFPLKKDVRRLLTDMLDTVKKARGIGLAATQVSKSLNVAIIYLVEMDDRLDRQPIPAFPIINPKITSASSETLTIEEGCLSMPGVFGPVKRPKKVTVEFFDMAGKKHQITDDGWIARVCQHEIDHLHNVLIIDKMQKVTQGAELLKNYSEG